MARAAAIFGGGCAGRRRGVWAEWAAKAASSAHCPRRLSYAKAVKIALPDAFFDSHGLSVCILNEVAA